ncbi:MAG: hypothetical protein HZB53_06260 [Chloroflexi bacterium]|nr:hypothetical protein [Chloroflexota bacterium]
MATNSIERPRYYQRQFLGAEDFQAEQSYHRDMRRRHNLAHHTWGIVTGLRLLQALKEGTTDEYDVFVQPGMAIDGYGREIVLLSPLKLDAAQFNFTAAVGYQEVWIGFRDQTALPPRFGYGLCAADDGSEFDQSRRWQESGALFIAPEPGSAVPPGVVIDGVETEPATPPPYDTTKPEQAAPPPVKVRYVPEDSSAPFQELPSDEDADPRWLIKLGSVNWDGQKSRFLKSTDERLNEDRRYIGAVAETLYAPAGGITLRHRARPLSKQGTALVFDPDAQELAQIEGRLRVDGRLVARDDVFLWGGKLSFQTANGPAPNSDEDKVPLWIRRRSSPDLTVNDVHIHLGNDDSAADDKPSAKTRLTVGPNSGTGEKAVLAVKANDHVEIVTGSLDFGAQTRQMVNLWRTNYGLGVQSGTLYLRSDSEYRWYRGGKHADDLNSSDNGVLQMRLDNQGRLHFGATVRQMLNLWQTSYGIGVQDSTLYFRTGADVCWFRGGVESPTRGDAGAGGSLLMKLNQAGTLSVSGQLGVGVGAPATRLHVKGDRIRLESVDGTRTLDMRADGSALDLESHGAPLYLNGAGSNQPTYINPFGGNVGIGTTTPNAKLDVDGTFRVGGGSTFAQLDTGRATVGSSATNEKQISIPFTAAFTTAPNVIATARGSNADVFAVTTTAVATTQFTVRIKRVDAAGGWAQNLQLDWFAAK